MTKSIPDLVSEIEALQVQLDEALTSRREEFDFEVADQRVVFDEETSERHASHKRGMMVQFMNANPFILLTSPFIYSVLLPFALLDLFVSVYQLICFPIYKVAKVSRRSYVAFDRRYLGYLNGFEKLNCMYCSYATGVVSYATEIISRTEQYWCPIKHARHLLGVHSRYADFLEYGDAEGYQDGRRRLRQDIQTSE